jgi:recombination protein RecT
MNENAIAVVCRAIADPAMQDKFRSVLPPNVSLDRFTRVTLTAVQNNPALLECDRASLYNACVTAAQRGLLPDGKEGALVSFNTKQGDQWVKKVQFMPMPEGIIKEMAKAGIKAYAASVYEHDTIEIWSDDDGQHVMHRPKVFGDRGERVGAYASAKDADGRTYVEAMNMAELARAAAASRSKDKAGNPIGPWKDWPERMEQKTVLHRLRKRVAILGDDDVVERLREDDEAALLDHAPTPAVEAVEPPSAPSPAKRPKTLQAIVEAEPEPAPPYSDEEVF